MCSAVDVINSIPVGFWFGPVILLIALGVAMVCIAVGYGDKLSKS